MSGYQKVIAVGNLGRDPETTYAQAGTAVTKFSVAVSEKWKKDGQQQERTEWVSCVAFGRLAEVCGEYLRKGSKVLVEGKLNTSSWEKDGQKHYRTEVVLNTMQMLDSRSTQSQPQTQPQPTGGQPAFDEGIPF